MIVTSALPGEGKTVSVANLGITLAQSGKTVLIVDADLRKPRQHRLFNVKNTFGLTSYLTDSIEIGKVVKTTAVPNLWLVNSGPVPPNPAELLGLGEDGGVRRDVEGQVRLHPVRHAADSRDLGRADPGGEGRRHDPGRPRRQHVAGGAEERRGRSSICSRSGRSGSSSTTSTSTTITATITKTIITITRNMSRCKTGPTKLSG